MSIGNSKMVSSSEIISRPKNGYLRIDEDVKQRINESCESYKKFLNICKTERETCEHSIKVLEENGFLNIESVGEVKPGDRVYKVNRGKGVVAIVVGREPLEHGLNITGAHADVPRIDLKPNPLVENNGLACLKTQYYGGIKKYQWLTLPLALHGVVVKNNGEKVNIVIGENENDPCFYISDLLPHLAREQMKKKMGEAIDGESMNVLVGTIPSLGSEEKEKVKFNVLKILNEFYGMIEEDFISSELEIVPALTARDVGLDRSMIGSYGHDDRVCCYTTLGAICNVKNPKKTCVCLLVDKEEIGSVGSTGARSRFFEDAIVELMYLMNQKEKNLTLRKCFGNSLCLSADVGAAFDPNFPEVFDKSNSAAINSGMILSKYSGGSGKGNGNDATAETMGTVRRILNDNGVIWQSACLGRVDLGGGGTIAGFFANFNIETVDCGVPLLSMHAPFEVAGKLDVYMSYLAFLSFFNS